MATELPDLTKQPRPTPQPSGGVARYRGEIPNIEAAGEGRMALGAADINAGGSLNKDAHELFHAYKVEQERADHLRAEEAFSKLRDAQLDLTVGPDNGYERLKGSQAVGRPVLDDYRKRFDDQVDLIGGSLATDAQKEKFRKAASVARMQFQEGLARHLVKQSDVYAKEVFDGTVKSEVHQATANWDNPMSVGLSIERVTSAVNDQAERDHWPKEYQTAVLQEKLGLIHSSVIQQALASNNYVYAHKWYETHREDVDVQTAKVLERAVEDGTQKQLTAGYTTQYLQLSDNAKGLETLHREVMADAKLDDTRKNILVGRIQTRMEVLANRAERQRAQQERVLTRAIDQVNSITLAGYEPTVEQMAPLVAAAKGTDFEPQVQQMVAVANATKQFRLSTPQQQESTITRLESEARKDPTKFDIKVIDRFKHIYAAQQQEIKQDPVTFAARQGLVGQDELSAQPLNLSDPTKLGPQLQARFDLSRAMAARYQAPVKPLTKEEADQLTGVLKAAPAAKKGQYFAALATASGQDFDGYKAMIAQIAPDDPVTAHAGIMAGRGQLSTTAGFEAEPGKATNVANLILQGQAVLHPNRKEDGNPEKGKLWPMPKDADFDKVWQSYERDAFAGKPEARNGFLQTAKAIYAARTVEAGDGSGVLDSGRWDEAMKLATGGIERWNGKSVLMPWGYSRGQFKDELYRRIDDFAGAERLAPGTTAGKLHDLPLESIGDGRYLFRAGDGLMVDKDGRPLIVDFNAPLPFRTSGYGRKTYPDAKDDFSGDEHAVSGPVNFPHLRLPIVDSYEGNLPASRPPSGSSAPSYQGGGSSSGSVPVTPRKKRRE
jgi:hypothetical protein